MKKILGMMTLAMGLTMITIVICDLRNPMMSFLIGRPAQVYILMISVCAVASGVVLIRECFFAPDGSKRRSAESEKQKNPSGKNAAAGKEKSAGKTAAAGSESTAAAAARTNAAKPAAPVSGTSAAKPAAPAGGTNTAKPAAPVSGTNAAKPAAPAGGTNTAKAAAPVSGTNTAKPAAPAGGTNTAKPAAPKPAPGMNEGVSATTAGQSTIHHETVSEFSLDDILGEDWK